MQVVRERTRLASFEEASPADENGEGEAKSLAPQVVFSKSSEACPTVLGKWQEMPESLAPGGWRSSSPASRASIRASAAAAPQSLRPTHSRDAVWAPAAGGWNGLAPMQHLYLSSPLDPVIAVKD